MTTIPYKITLDGDKDYARNFIGAAQSQMRILENQMSFRNLKQGVRSRPLDQRTTVEASVCFDLKEVKIYSEPIKKIREIEEELLGIGRFFAKVRRGGLYGETKFYWITFTKNSEGNTKISASSAGSSSEILGRMSAIPYTTLRATHSFTKSFMVENDNKKEERWVAAPHLLVKEEVSQEGQKFLTEVFNPLGYPYVQSDLIGDDPRYYPLPPLFNPFGYDFPTHPTPPNRFYCNVDGRKMVWYSCYSVLDNTNPSVPVLVHYCFGIILTLTDNMAVRNYFSPGSGTAYQEITDSKTGKELIKTFNCYSAEADDKGFKSLWYYEKPDPDCNPLDPPIDPMCGADADVPYQMLLDVNSLDEETLEVFVPWNERPTKFTVDLTGSSVGTTEEDHTYEEVTETQHWYWTGDGFEQKKFANLEYNEIESGVVKSSASPIPMGSTPGCGGTGLRVLTALGHAPSAAQASPCTGGCSGKVGNYTEIFQGTWSRTCYRSPGGTKFHRETIYEIFVPGKTAKMTSRDWEIATVQGKSSDVEYCVASWGNCGTVYVDGVAYTEWELHCSKYSSGRACLRYIAEELKQKIADSFNADWCSPNVAFIGATKDRIFVDAFEEMGRISYDWSDINGTNKRYFGIPEYANLSEDKVFADSYWGEGTSGIDGCNYGLPASSFLPYQGVDLWGTPVDSVEFSGVTSISGYSPDCLQTALIDSSQNRKKTSNKNTLDEPLVLQYQVDGEGSFNSTLFNRTYYLDDRSSNDSEGLLVAARGAEVADYELDEETLTPGDPIFNVARWSAVYKFPGEDSFNVVTDELLEALRCDVSELIELGLI